MPVICLCSPSYLRPQLMNEENGVHIHNRIIYIHTEIMSLGKNDGTWNYYAKYKRGQMHKEKYCKLSFYEQSIIDVKCVYEYEVCV